MQNKPAGLSPGERFIIAVMILIVVAVAMEGAFRAAVEAQAPTLHEAADEYVAFRQMQRREAGLTSLGPGWTTEHPR